jgi:hypothetical protein
MDKKEKNNGDMHRHIQIAVFANLISTGLLAGGHFVQRPVVKVVAWAGAILVWGVLAYLIKFLIRPKWEGVKKVGYYFIPSLPFFWALDQYKRRLDAEKEVSKLKGILQDWPAAKIAQKITDHVSRREGLETILADMDNMSDRDLALIVRSIQYYADDIWESPGNGGHYNLFWGMMEKISLYGPDDHTQTFESLLWLLSDIYDIKQVAGPRRQVQKDMMTPLKNVIWRTDEAHLNPLRGVMTKIMLDANDDHDLARPILEMLLTLHPKTQRLIWQLVFDECEERAFMFPERFGHDFLQKLNELGYKSFWLDFHSLRSLWMEPQTPDRKGLLVSQQPKFSELCSGVFAAVEDPQQSGIRDGRVFRRLVGDAGKANVECVLPNGEMCHCEGKSLSFRGIFSQDCVQKAAERLKVKIIPLLEPNRQLKIAASVAKLHTDESGKEVDGRGIFFEEADEATAKSAHEFVSKH